MRRLCFLWAILLFGGAARAQDAPPLERLEAENAVLRREVKDLAARVAALEEKLKSIGAPGAKAEEPAIFFPAAEASDAEGRGPIDLLARYKKAFEMKDASLLAKCVSAQSLRLPEGWQDPQTIVAFEIREMTMGPSPDEATAKVHIMVLRHGTGGGGPHVLRLRRLKGEWKIVGEIESPHVEDEKGVVNPDAPDRGQDAEIFGSPEHVARAMIDVASKLAFKLDPAKDLAVEHAFDLAKHGEFPVPREIWETAKPAGFPGTPGLDELAAVMKIVATHLDGAIVADLETHVHGPVAVVEARIAEKGGEEKLTITTVKVNGNWLVAHVRSDAFPADARGILECVREGEKACGERETRLEKVGVGGAGLIGEHTLRIPFYRLTLAAEGEGYVCTATPDTPSYPKLVLRKSATTGRYEIQEEGAK
jgi:hypothetical protein